ncbi:MAG TPA: threonine synthase [Verrucomicrobia subdivision 6 bacterium]|jgi:threonine synthase|uniref:Threonine synthase n=3 Tax=Verrucomicrobia subdivision 6 TaxID=134627 RepID=A0A0R2XH86_9BACT|nr:MAG: threonine synthase [Verrucomicrobia subdivision 6 bacterium BACL9 MAG-120507-bin52]KRP32494.1 MAG: threonine synthase [Verrucomicrobia subdivision 6 bacterium BACL9 MAG-120820-bin42]KRP34206.1 MAG: threonine synthase [Verrucomicrobia subdivision 6 bacterium BACL9 MAG-120924-bin69]MDA0325021.1 threonine synthase [Verrucomicrobiota bacterium]HBZ85348.1 threonine synthase [Verrucomicrobia subdivision 6 bacterium]HCP05847.1 threonine synthase [Verrucomicrobiales bacterium]
MAGKFFSKLKCRECGRTYPPQAIHVCEFDFGPLEADYDYGAIGSVLTRKVIESRGNSMWRYRELLPIEGEPTVGKQVGFTPLVKADRLAKAIGVKACYVKNDTVNHPTLSFKDRVVAVALSRARELGFKVVACASTGNLANSVAANAASAGMESWVLIPADLEQNKVMNSLVYGTNVVGIEGAYDAVNRLCSEIAGKYGWGFVNVNLRPYYAEGSKTVGYEVMEQLGWRIPRHTVVCMASGSLLTKIDKSYKEFTQLGLVSKSAYAIHGAQATGCNPISSARKGGTDLIRPVPHPKTIAKSLAIGTPADGYYAVKSMSRTGGWAEDATDEEIIEGMKLLAETEGIFAETAGGVTVACARKLVETGKIPHHEEVVLCITGHGLKTVEALTGHLGAPSKIKPSLRDFDALLSSGLAKARVKV